MTITITAFEDALDRGAGLARDMIVRWALEEAGQAYEVRLVPWADFRKPAHRKLQPFGQIPTYEEGDLVACEYRWCRSGRGRTALRFLRRFRGVATGH